MKRISTLILALLLASSCKYIDQNEEASEVKNAATAKDSSDQEAIQYARDVMDHKEKFRD